VLDQAFGRLSPDLAVDLGTCNTRLYVRGRGIAVEVPTVVAVERSGSARRVVAVGDEAKRMLGRTPEHIEALRPVRGGKIEDYNLAQAIVQDCIGRSVPGRSLVRPRMVVCLPGATEEVQRRAIQESARALGARQVHLVAKSCAAAIGAGMPVHQAICNVVVDLGGGLTEISALSLGGVVESEAVAIGGDDLDEAIAGWIRDQMNVLVGARAAEQIKQQAGRAIAGGEEADVIVTGRDLSSGIPREVRIRGGHLVEALSGPLGQVVEGIRRLLSRLSPEMAGDVADQGILLTGGGAMLRGMDSFLREASGLSVVVAENPGHATVIGAGRLLDDEASLERLTL
jgi:rod shape-determining protein MreB